MEICWPRVFFAWWYVWEQDSLDICINHVNAGWTIKHLVLWSYGTDFRKKQISNCRPKTDIFPPFTTFTFNHTVDRRSPAPVEMVNISLFTRFHTRQQQATQAFHTFTPLLSQGCLDGVVFPEKKAGFAPQKERNGNCSTSQGLELFLWWIFTMANRQFRENCVWNFFPASNSREA